MTRSLTGEQFSVSRIKAVDEKNRYSTNRTNLSTASQLADSSDSLFVCCQTAECDCGSTMHEHCNTIVTPTGCVFYRLTATKRIKTCTFTFRSSHKASGFYRCIRGPSTSRRRRISGVRNTKTHFIYLSCSPSPFLNTGSDVRTLLLT